MESSSCRTRIPQMDVLPAHGNAKGPYAVEGGRVEVLSRLELTHCRHWQGAFVGQRKDHRFYELVEDTIRQGFDYQYFAIKGGDGDDSGDSAVLYPRTGSSRRP